MMRALAYLLGERRPSDAEIARAARSEAAKRGAATRKKREHDLMLEKTRQLRLEAKLPWRI